MAVPVLDSDTLNNLLTASRAYPQLRKRVLEADPSALFITIISVEENLRGLLNKVHADRDKPSASERFGDFAELPYAISCFQILPFDAQARPLFEQMPAKVKRHGSNDCRIAAIAISRGEMVVTRNLSDFNRIPGIACEDWTTELCQTMAHRNAKSHAGTVPCHLSFYLILLLIAQYASYSSSVSSSPLRSVDNEASDDTFRLIDLPIARDIRSNIARWRLLKNASKSSLRKSAPLMT